MVKLFEGTGGIGQDCLQECYLYIICEYTAVVDIMDMTISNMSFACRFFFIAICLIYEGQLISFVYSLTFCMLMKD